jgi:Phosphotransferase enzyme family
MATSGPEMSAFVPQPAPAGSLADTSQGKEALARKAAELVTPDFIESRIRPLLGPAPAGNHFDPRVEIVQNTGTGRLTLRYVLDSETTLFGKLYVDELGPHCYKVSRALWDDGFNSARRFRVPEPIGFLADRGLLLMRSALGTPLGSAFDGNASVDLVAGSREAAEWLGLLHRSRLCLGTPDTDWDSLKLFRLASRLVKAVAMRPEKLDMVRELSETLEQRTAKLPASRPFVFTHGRYHHDHVFLSANATTVIDLDRCRPSDPAKDAAEFVRVLRLTAFKEGFDMDCAERATSAFLGAYLATIPEAAESLGCYWATYVFHSLLGGLKKARNKGKKSWEELEEFYVAEMTRAWDCGR